MKKNKTNQLILIGAVLAISITSLIIFIIYKPDGVSVKSEVYSDSMTSTSTATINVIATSTLDMDTESEYKTEKKLYKFLEVTDGCGTHSDGVCVNMRKGPGTEFPVVLGLRTGIILNVEKVVTNSKGENWLKIHFVNALAYPERVKSDLYVAESVVKIFYDEGNVTKVDKDAGPITKRIVINVTEQMLYAYDGDTLFMKESVSTGLKDTPTKVGTYSVYKKTPSRYMQGAANGQEDQYYDLPGVPWNLYFTYDGDVIHGAYWHNSFGQKWSHGCVNMKPQSAEKLYKWAVVGTPVIVEE